MNLSILHGLNKDPVRDIALLGLFENSWSLTHDDNSLGFLHVLPEFRRKGYGKEISKSMILQKRKENKQVFVNIEPTNQSSINLVTSMGFVPDRKISWIKLK